MKFLIQNYVNAMFTEPLYFNAVLNEIPGCESKLWEKDKISAYDIMDEYQPDFFIGHAGMIPVDMLTFFSKEKPKAQVILNITGAGPEQYGIIQKSIVNYGVSCAFLYVNYSDHSYVSDILNIVTILHGADPFFENTDNNKFNIDKCFMLYRKPEQNIVYDKSYHVASTVNIEGIDFALPTMSMGNLYRNYDEIEFMGMQTIIPQSFFDAIYYGNKVIFNYGDNPQSKMLHDEICRVFKVKDLSDSDKIKQIVKTKHTAYNRVKTLLSQLPCNDQLKALSSIMEKANT